MNPKVDAFLNKVELWSDELAALREILLECPVEEELKWGVPTYCFNKKNIILLGGFKDNFVLSFVKGVLLADTEGILQAPGENSQSVRVIRFTSRKQVVDLAPVIKAYIYEAIEVEKAGLKVDMPEKDNLEFSEELMDMMDKDAKFKAAFEALTQGRKRGYNMFFNAAKQSKTRLTRIEKYIPRILNGKGIHDCVCGHSKRMPTCDGSHKNYES